ncbi:hydroxymethylbilane synthase, partial [Paraburkholderia caledonica]
SEVASALERQGAMDIVRALSTASGPAAPGDGANSAADSGAAGTPVSGD